jgi:two-component system, LytTR family, response regulator
MIEIIIPTDRGAKKVFMQNIIRVEANSNYSKIFFCNEQPLTVAKVLHWFEDNLPNDFFWRIHRTHIVNRIFVTDVNKKSMLQLSNGESLQISRRKKTAIKTEMNTVYMQN